MSDPADTAVYEVLLTVVRSLVDDPDQVDIQCVPGQNGATFQVSVIPSDVGKVIGMGGRTARAIRTIISANAARRRRSYSIDIAAKLEAPSPPVP